MRLLHGDCLEKMAEIEDGSVDLVLADPPYGTTLCPWDSIIPLEPMWDHLRRVIKPNGVIVMTASQPFTTTLIASNMPMFKYCWVWEKSIPSQFNLCNKRVMKWHEDVVVFHSSRPLSRPVYNPQFTSGRRNHSKGGAVGKPCGPAHFGSMLHYAADTHTTMKHPKSVIRIANPRIKNQHPTQKPVELMEYLIKTYTNEGGTVLDFAMGSGTTGVACANLNRSFIGIERDDLFYQRASDRLAAVSATQAPAEPPPPDAAQASLPLAPLPPHGFHKHVSPLAHGREAMSAGVPHGAVGSGRVGAVGDV